MSSDEEEDVNNSARKNDREDFDEEEEGNDNNHEDGGHEDDDLKRVWLKLCEFKSIIERESHLTALFQINDSRAYVYLLFYIKTVFVNNKYSSL